jgi:hypothetical protein
VELVAWGATKWVGGPKGPRKAPHQKKGHPVDEKWREFKKNESKKIKNNKKKIM